MIEKWKYVEACVHCRLLRKNAVEQSCAQSAGGHEFQIIPLRVLTNIVMETTDYTSRLFDGKDY
jgi:hypothetical protein